MHPVLFEIGPVRIYSYGAMLAFAFLTAVFFARRRANSLGIDGDLILDLAVYLIISGLIGARTLFILLNLAYYKARPLEVIMIWRGGLAWYGGLIAALLTGIIFLKIKKAPVLKVGDLMVPYVALGQSIGRVGCFLNGCCYGKPTTLPIGVKFPGLEAPVHPTQLYESAAMLIIFFILVRRLPQNGKTMSLYLIFYSIFRFLNEFLRADAKSLFMGLSHSQVISAVILMAAIILWRSIPSR